MNNPPHNATTDAMEPTGKKLLQRKAMNKHDFHSIITSIFNTN